MQITNRHVHIAGLFTALSLFVLLGGNSAFAQSANHCVDVVSVPIRSAQTPTIRSMLSGSMRPLTPPYLVGVCDNRIGTVVSTSNNSGAFF